MNFPLVSVIIACHNGEAYIDECMQSLVDQTYKNIEILVCDDASTDNSADLLQCWADKDDRIKIFHNEKNLYAAAARNKCIENAHGEFFMIQDIDDKSEPDRTEKLLEVLQKEKNIDIAASAMHVFLNDGTVLNQTIRPKKEYPNKWDFLWGPPLACPTAMMSKECVDAVSGYRIAPETRRAQDYDMYMRMFAKGYKIKNIDSLLYWYRNDNDNTKRKALWFSVKDEIAIRYKGFKELNLLPLGMLFVLKPIPSLFYEKVRVILNG